MLAVAPALARQALDWQQQIRERVAAKQLDAALAIAERRLADSPEDLEARGWRARLLGWTGQWKEAEAEYRCVLESAPRDTDILLGLADVLIWQQRFDEALPLLDRAQQINPALTDAYIRQGRALGALGRTREAHEAFRQALALDPGNTEAQASLALLPEELRYELRVGADIDSFNYTEQARAFTVGLRSHFNPRWETNFAGIWQQRFGQEAARFSASVTYRPRRRDALTLGGSVARDRGIIAKSESFFEYGHGSDLRSQRFLHGIEPSYQQHWLWYQGARVLALSPSVVFYLPREWTWSVRVTVARSRFASLPAEWRPSGLTRLSFPLYRRLTGNVFYAVGTENFALVEQVGRFSARTFGGGLRYVFTRRQEIAGYVFLQDRSQGRNQTSFGFSYAIRF